MYIIYVCYLYKKNILNAYKTLFSIIFFQYKQIRFFFIFKSVVYENIVIYRSKRITWFVLVKFYFKLFAFYFMHFGDITACRTLNIYKINAHEPIYNINVLHICINNGVGCQSDKSYRMFEIDESLIEYYIL